MFICRFIENGFWVKNKKRLTRHYVREGTFKYDLLALTPTDLVSIKILCYQSLGALRQLDAHQTWANRGPDSTFVFEVNLKCLVPNARRTSNMIYDI